ncbi:Methyltransferase FkbM family [Histomonas meleagridis]|nr:Methyltransferase FkbM family [Histomonas meleagridis]
MEVVLLKMPYLIDSTAVHDLENPTMRSVRECLKVGYSHIEYSPYSTYQSISSSEAADFIIQQLHKQTTEHILVKGYSNTTIEASIQNVLNTLHLSQCKIHFRNYSHKIDKLPQPNKIEHIGSPNSDVHQMLTEAYKDFSYKENPIPYMSIVVTGRHDNFSGGYMMRSQNTLTSIDYALSQVPLANIEVVFVDYATAETTTLLSEEFVIGPNLRNKVRFIIVPPKSHEKLCEKLNKKIAFFEYIAKNIGTRRSFGKFVLTANTDDLFSKNDGITMMELIGNVTEIWKLRKMDINQRCGHGSYRFAIVDSSDAFSKKSYPCATGDFLLLSKDLWDAVQGFNELPANPGVDTVFQARMMKFAPGFARMFVYPLIIHQRHPRQNMFRPSVANSEEVLNEYTCKGTCKLCSPYYDSDDWGLKNENFSVIIR